MKHLLVACFFILVFLFKITNALAQIASGLHNPVFGALALSQGNAFVARSDDASAIAFNPAGLTQLERPQVSVGSSFLISSVEYEDNGASEDMGTEVNTIPFFYFASPILKNKLAAGIGVTSPYGLHGEWDDEGFSRFVITEFDLKIININPTLTLKPFSFLSLGVGLDYYYAESNQNKRFAPLAPGAPEGFEEIDAHGDAFGYNAGILCNITPRHSIGIAFRSKADFDFDGNLKLSKLGVVPDFDIDTKTTATIPEMLSFGYAYRHGSLWSIEADVQWTNWSRFDVLKSDFEPANTFLGASHEEVRNWNNTLGFALGGEYCLNETTKVRGGYAFHESPVPSETFEPSVPQSSRHALFTGLGYGWGRNLNKWVNFAYGIVFYENRKIDNSVGEDATKPLMTGPPIDGRYDILTHIIAIDFSYKF